MSSIKKAGSHLPTSNTQLSKVTHSKSPAAFAAKNHKHMPSGSRFIDTAASVSKKTKQLQPLEDDDDEDEDDEDYTGEDDEDDDSDGEDYEEAGEEDDDIYASDVDDDESGDEEGDAEDDAYDSDLDSDDDPLKEMEGEESEDEGEAHLDLLYKDASLDKDDIGEYEAHDLTKKEKKKYIDDLNLPISKLTHSMIALFRDMLTYYLFANREEVIKKNNPDDILTQEVYVKMVKSIKVSEQFQKDIKAAVEEVMKVLGNREKYGKYRMLCFIVQTCLRATRMRAIPLSDIVQMVPSIDTKQGFESTLTRESLDFQKTAVANQGVFLNVTYPDKGTKKLLNITVTKQQMALISSLVFVNKAIDRVKYEVARKIRSEDDTVTIDSIIDKHIEKDPKQMIPSYARALSRCFVRISKLLPEVKDKIPKYFIEQ